MRLILMDSTELENGKAGYADGRLWLTVVGMTLPEAAAIFFDPTKTGVIVFEYGEMRDTYEGYTVCVSLSVDSDGTISVCMVRG